MDANSPIPLFHHTWQFQVIVASCLYLKELLMNQPSIEPVANDPHAWVLEGYIPTPADPDRAMAELGRRATCVTLEKCEDSEDTLCRLVLHTPNRAVIEKEIFFFERDSKRSELAEKLENRAKYPEVKDILHLPPLRRREGQTFVQSVHRMSPFYGFIVPPGLTLFVPVIKKPVPQASEVLDFTPKKPIG